MPTEEEIRELCLRVTMAPDADQFKAALTELKIAIREHITDAENRSIHLLLRNPRAASLADKKKGTKE